MSLIKCPDCGKEISSYVENCPHCGYPLKKKKECHAVNPVIVESYKRRTDDFFVGAGACFFGGIVYILLGFLYNLEMYKEYTGPIWWCLIVGVIFIVVGIAFLFVGRRRQRIAE